MPRANKVAVRINDSGSRPRTVALGTTCTSRAGNLKRAGTMVGGEVGRYAALVKRGPPVLPLERDGRRCRRLRAERAAYRSHPSDPAPSHCKLGRSHRRSRLLARQRQQHAHCIGDRNHRRPAVRNERQCHAFGGHEVQVDRHIDRRLRGEQDGQARGGKTSEWIVSCAWREPACG